MNQFFTNLKAQAQENPILILGVGAAVVTATAKLVDAAGHARGSHAYAKDVNRRVKANKK